MVYKELVTLQNLYPNREEGNRQVKRQSSMYELNRPELQLLLSVKDYSHFFDKHFMGIEFATELSWFFYSEKKFVLQHPGELDVFLSNDRFQTKCTPSDQIRVIAVEVSLRSFNIKNGISRAWSSPKFMTPLKQHYSAVVRGLDALKRLRKPSPTIRFRINSYMHDAGAGSKFAEALVPLVYALKGKGCIVEFEEHLSRRTPSIATDFNYDIPRKNWDLKIKNDCTFVSSENGLNYLLYWF
jgi:hypothetical protein